MIGEPAGRQSAATIWMAALLLFCTFPVLARGVEADPDFALEGPTAIEVDADGRVVWSTDAAAQPVSVRENGDGERLVADRGRGVVMLFSAAGDLVHRLPVPTPAEADFLPNGNLLVTSLGKRAVEEIDRQGKVVWSFDQLHGPRDADRLPNGNTLICDDLPPRVIEVSPEGEVVWLFSKGLKLPTDAEWVSDDEILVADYNAHVVMSVARDLTDRWQLNYIGHPTEIHVLPDGTGLVSAEQAGMLVRFDHQRVLASWTLGRKLLDFSLAPNGNLLLAISPAPREGETPRPFSPLVASRILHGRAPTGPGVESLPFRSFDRPRLLLLILLPVLIIHLLVGLWPALRRRWSASYSLVILALAFVALFLGMRLGPPKRGAVSVARPPARKNVVLILFDSLRKDHVPWYGYWRNTTPALLQLSKRALVFDQYIVQSSWTKPSVASLLTSTYPSTHGAISQKSDSQLPTSLLTLPEVLQDAGYHTAAVMENPHMGDRRSAKGFDQGFDSYRYIRPDKLKDKLPGLVTDYAIEALDDRPPGRPFFLMVFFLNPHYPYEPNKPHFGDMHSGPSNPGPINDYDGEIYDADREVGRLLDALGQRDLLESTVVIFSTDHGEEFGDHGARYHGSTLYDGLIDVPLLIAGIGRVGRFGGLVREIDIMPTLLDYLGVDADADGRAQMAGLSVRRLIDEGVGKTGLVAYSETKFKEGVDLLSERTEDTKVIVSFANHKVEKYALDKDPQEYNNLVTPGEAAAELTRFQQWAQSRQPVSRDQTAGQPVPEEVKEQMRALGYAPEE